MKITFIIFLSLTLFSGCKKDSEDMNKGAIYKLSGTYSSVLPCRDCQGVNYEITLNENMTFVERLVYIGKDTKPYVSEGLWKMENFNKAVLFKKTDDMSQFEYSKGDLVMLNGEGKRYDGPDAEKYNLKRGPMQPVVVEQKYDSTINKTDTNSATINGIWKLTDINGQKIDSSNYHNGIPNLEIKKSEEKFYGSTGCNKIRGKISTSSTSIAFTDFIFTKMSCPGTGESEYISALASVDTFIFEKGKLTLVTAGKPVLIYLR